MADPLQAIAYIKTRLLEKSYGSHVEAFGVSYSKTLQTQIKSKGILESFELVSQLNGFNCLDAVLFSSHILLTLYSKLIHNRHIIIFPISFSTSTRNNKKYSHVILGCCINLKFGALGLSRSTLLTSKPFYQNSLSGIVTDYVKSFKVLHLQVKKIKIGSQITLDNLTCKLDWKKEVIYLNDNASSRLDFIGNQLIQK